MDETEYFLETSVSATIGAGGTVVVMGVGPQAANERWRIRRFSASGTSVAKLQIYRGNSVDRTKQIDVTVRADNDTSETDVPMRTGETITFGWSGGVPGAQMTCRVEGQRFVKGRRAY